MFSTSILDWNSSCLKPLISLCILPTCSLVLRDMAFLFTTYSHKIFIQLDRQSEFGGAPESKLSTFELGTRQHSELRSGAQRPTPIDSLNVNTHRPTTVDSYAIGIIVALFITYQIKQFLFLCPPWYHMRLIGSKSVHSALTIRRLWAHKHAPTRPLDW